MDFASWVKGGIAELTPDDIARSEKDLSPKFEDEKQLGTVDGDLLKLWAFTCKNTRVLRQDLLAHDKAHDNKDEHDAACQANARELINRLRRHKLLVSIFWHDARASLGDKASPSIALRKGMIIVEEESDLPSISILLSTLNP